VSNFDSNNLSAYTRQPSGALVAAGPATPAPADHPYPVALAIDPSGHFLFTGLRGLPGTPQIRVYAIDANGDGGLSDQNVSVDLDDEASDLEVEPGGKFLYATMPFARSVKTAP